MKKGDLDKLVFDAIAANLKSASGQRAYVMQHGGSASLAEVRDAVQRLRYSGRVRLDRLEVNQVAAPPEVEAVSSAAQDRVAEAAGEVRSVTAQVKAEAVAAGQRRRLARNTGTVRRPLGKLTPAEKVVSLMVEEPGDLYVLVKRQWPELLSGVISRARDNQVSPVRQLVATIEAGLDSLHPGWRP